MVYVDPDIVHFYFWVHVILLGVIVGIWLYQMPADEDDNRPTPKDEDEDWPGW